VKRNIQWLPGLDLRLKDGCEDDILTPVRCGFVIIAGVLSTCQEFFIKILRRFNSSKILNLMF
jgi:hypothetical protein